MRLERERTGTHTTESSSFTSSLVGAVWRIQTRQSRSVLEMWSTFPLARGTGMVPRAGRTYFTLRSLAVRSQIGPGHHKFLTPAPDRAGSRTAWIAEVGVRVGGAPEGTQVASPPPSSSVQFARSARRPHPPQGRAGTARLVSHDHPQSVVHGSRVTVASDDAGRSRGRDRGVETRGDTTLRRLDSFSADTLGFARP